MRWHYSDPADENEVSRSQRIAAFQDGKVNPFILYCTLAERTCCEQAGDCGSVAISKIDNSNIEIHLIQYERKIKLIANTKSWTKSIYSIINSSGQVIRSSDNVFPVENIIEIDACNFSQGIYFINYRFEIDSAINMKIFKFIVTAN